jgi:signal transduction histidine kinase
VDSRAPDRQDLLVALLVTASGMAIASLAYRTDASPVPVLLAVGAQAAAGVVVLLWRTVRPGPAALVLAALAWLSPSPGILVLTHALGRVGRGKKEWIWLAVSVAVSTAAIAWTFMLRADALVACALLPVLTWVVGHGMSDAEAQARAREVREQVALVEAAAQARRENQERLARETHDTVAHRISLMVLHANLLEDRSADPAVHDAVVAIREEGRRATDDLRSVFGLPPRHGPAAAPLSLAWLPALVDDARRAGQPVSADLAAPGGRPPQPAEAPAVLIVREALTNAVVHAPGRTTNVRTTVQDGRLCVAVVNTLGDEPVTTDGPGTGLRGIAARASEVGGTATYGPTPDGGFAVSAELPWEAT